MAGGGEGGWDREGGGRVRAGGRRGGQRACDLGISLPPPTPAPPSSILFRSLPAAIDVLKKAQRGAATAAAAAAAKLASADSLLNEDLLRRKEELEGQADEGGLQEERWGGGSWGGRRMRGGGRWRIGSLPAGCRLGSG